MGRVGFTTENKGKVVNFDYPKFKLKNGEKARIILGLEDPVMEYVHTLRKPVIADGRPVTEMVKNDRTGVSTLEYKKDFVGNPICLGDEGVVADKGLDPKNCPACKLAQDFPDYAEPPKRRFAMHIIRYRTKSGSFTVANPFSVDILVWSFTDMVFNKLVDFKEEWGDLRRLDFLAGPCTNETFHKFDLNPGSDAAWLKDPDHKKIVAETFRDNQIPDLTVAVGRNVQPEWMKQDVAGIIEAWRQAKGAEDKGEGSQGNLDDDLNGLLGGADDKDEDGWATPEAAAAEGLGDLDDLMSVSADDKPAKGLSAEAAEAEPVDADDAFGDLLAGSVGLDDNASDDGDEDAAEDLLAETEAAPAKKPAAKKATAKKEEEAAPAADNFDDLLNL